VGGVGEPVEWSPRRASARSVSRQSRVGRPSSGGEAGVSGGLDGERREA
jgi:hypothetical protein